MENKSFMWILLLLVIVIAGFAYYKGYVEIKLNTPALNTILQQSNNSQSLNTSEISGYTAPPLGVDWCVVQSMPSGEIIGWDAENVCCVYKYNNSLMKCFIGEIGTTVKWAKINGTYLQNPNDYINYVGA